MILIILRENTCSMLDLIVSFGVRKKYKEKRGKRIIQHM